MRRLIKGFVISIFYLQWSLPASATPAMCGSVVKNPSPPSQLIANTSSTQLDALGSFELTCCPDGQESMGGKVTLSIVSAQSTIPSGMATIKLSDRSDFADRIENIPYKKETSYQVKVSDSNGEILKPGDYRVAVKFELTDIPSCVLLSIDP